MKRCVPALVWLLSVCVAAPSVRAEQYYPVTTRDGDVRYPYHHSHPMLVCRPLHVCDIKLADRESILNIAVGDSIRWIVASAQSGPGGTTPHVFVKPTEYDLQTNLVVTTTRHDYYIDLTSARVRGPSRVSFYYPEEEAQANVAAALAARLAEPVASPSPDPPARLDFGYRISGDPSIAPHTAYNDGSHTYLLWTNLPNDLPVAYAVEPDGSEQIINYRVSGAIFVIDGLPTGIDLVLNAGTGKHDRGERRAHVRKG